MFIRPLYKRSIITNSMFLAEKIDRMQEVADVSLADFADLVGVNTATLRRLKQRGDATDRILQRLVRPFEGLTIEMLRDDKVGLPDSLALSADARAQVPASEDLSEGRKLSRYLDRLPRGARAKLADTIGVSRPQVNAYEHSERFRPEVRQAILTALGVDEQVVFGNRILSNVSPLLARPGSRDRVALPLIDQDNRPATAAELLALSRDFSPDDTDPQNVRYVEGSLFMGKPGAAPSSLAIAVSTSDNMEPRLLPGAVVLAQVLGADSWPLLADAIVALVTPGQALRVYRVHRNDLRTTGTLEIGAFDRNRGGSMTLRRDDIELLYHVTAILYSPL